MNIKETFELAFQNHKNNKFTDAEKLYKSILEEKSDHFESVFYLGILSMQTKNFNNAKNWYEKAIKINPNFPDVHNNLGTVFHNLQDFEKAQTCYEKAIKINPNFSDAHNNLGTIFHNQQDFEKAQKCYERAVKIKPNHPSANNNLASIFNELGKHKEAAEFCEKALKINPNNVSAYNNFGNALKYLKQYEKSIEYYKKALKLNPSYLSAYDNLGNILRDLGKPAEAKKYFENARTNSSKAEYLECIYFSENLNNYEKILKKFSKDDPLNRRIATIAAYVSKKEKIKNIYPFCKEPLDFVFIKNLKNQLESSSKFLENLSSELNKIQSVWEPKSVTTKGGYQSVGNLFENKNNTILELKKIIETQITKYREKYNDSGDFFIKKWPDRTKLRGWYVKLLKQGRQKSHIHPSGWLSGVFYLKIPKLLNAEEGSIEFTLYGYDYPKEKNLPSMIYSPKVFDLALFPSSLFHKTIPFNSDEERKVVAFDLVPE